MRRSDRSARFPETGWDWAVSCRLGHSGLARGANAAAAAKAGAYDDSISFNYRTRTGALKRSRPIRTPRERSKGGRGGQRVRRVARLHRVHRRSHAYHRRPEGAAAASGAIQGDRQRAQGEETCASCRASTTPRSTRARPTRNSSARRTTRSTTRACISSPGQRVRSALRDRRRAAAMAGGGPQGAAGRREHRRVDAPAVVRPLSAVGLGHARRREAIDLHAHEADVTGVLRPHPSGTPQDDRAHCASRGQVADVPAAGGGLAAATHAAAMGSRAARTADWAFGTSKRRRRTRDSS